MDDSFKDRLRLLRHANGWSQQKVANRLHINRSTYAYYEIGKTQPDYEILAAIAQLYGVSTDFLLGRASTSADTRRAFISEFLTLSDKEQARILRRLEDLTDLSEKT